MSVPQVVGMYKNDRTRKEILVDFGFRLPVGARQPAADVRGVRGAPQPGDLHVGDARPVRAAAPEQIVEQLIRPTGIVDPQITIHPTEGQIDDLIDRIRDRVERGERALVTTLTKKMAEDLADYLHEMGVKVSYLHSRGRHARAGPDPARPAPGRLRRGGGDQPAARGD